MAETKSPWMDLCCNNLAFCSEIEFFRRKTFFQVFSDLPEECFREKLISKRMYQDLKKPTVHYSDIPMLVLSMVSQNTEAVQMSGCCGLVKYI